MTMVMNTMLMLIIMMLKMMMMMMMTMVIVITYLFAPFWFRPVLTLPAFPPEAEINGDTAGRPRRLR